MASPSDLFRSLIRDEIRKNKKLSQRGLAQALGFTDKHISQMLNGKSKISLDYLPFMLDYVGLELMVQEKKEDSR